MEQMRIKHNETGRSMVEMLGVLAVVGVLSIGGVAGYRYAVDKMNANEIINELKKRAITASQQRVLGQGINLSEYGAILGKYEVTPANGYPEDPAFFGLEIAGVPERVCNMILESDWALPVEMKVGEVVVGDDTECAEGANTMTFAFNNTLGSGDVGNAGNTETSGRPPVDPNNECAKSDETPLRDQQGNCHSCDESGVVLVGDSGDCSVCDGTRGTKRYVSIYGISGKACVVANDCATGSEPNDATGRCECPENHLLIWGGECVPCGDFSSNDFGGTYDGFTYVVSVLEDNANEACGACGWVKKSLDDDLTGMAWCAKEEKKEICDKNGNCYDCSYNTSILGSIDVEDPSECYKCEGWYAQYNSCYKCPAEQIDNPNSSSVPSFFEDSIEKVCQACGLGVNWNMADGSGTSWVNCSLTSEDIGTKPGTVTTATQTQTETTTTTATQTQTDTSTDTSTISNPEVSVSETEPCENPCYEICCPDGYTCDRISDYPAFCMSSTSCTTNAECSSDAYCDYNIVGNNQDQKPDMGVCKALVYTESNDFIISNNFMNYWSAQNFCDRLGRSIISSQSGFYLTYPHFWVLEGEIWTCYSDNCHQHSSGLAYGSDNFNGLDAPVAVCK